MAKLLVKMIILLIALVGWVIYSNMDKITRFINDFETPAMFSFSDAKPERSQATQIYRWQDARGEWHFSSNPPDGQGNAELKTYDGSAN